MTLILVLTLKDAYIDGGINDIDENGFQQKIHTLLTVVGTYIHTMAFAMVAPTVGIPQRALEELIIKRRSFYLQV